MILSYAHPEFDLEIAFRCFAADPDFASFVRSLLSSERTCYQCVCFQITSTIFQLSYLKTTSLFQAMGIRANIIPLKTVIQNP
jgi:hypothetical protein